MTLLGIMVEGKTEETFVRSLLAPHLAKFDIDCSALPMMGNITVKRLTTEMALHAYHYDFVTSLVDFYGFRGKGDMDVEALTDHLSRCLIDSAGPATAERLLPYVQRHEFEALLFSEVDAFRSVARITEGELANLRRIRRAYNGPEDINDSPETAPSKRILKNVHRYDKVIDGNAVAHGIGIEKMKQECPRFAQWLARLESLATSHVEAP